MNISQRIMTCNAEFNLCNLYADAYFPENTAGLNRHARLRMSTSGLLSGKLPCISGAARHFTGAARHVTGAARHFTGAARHFTGAARLFTGAACHFIGAAWHFSGKTVFP
jgi:hypothetical protein